MCSPFRAGRSRAVFPRVRSCVATLGCDGSPLRGAEALQPRKFAQRAHILAVSSTDCGGAERLLAGPPQSVKICAICGPFTQHSPWVAGRSALRISEICPECAADFAIEARIHERGAQLKLSPTGHTAQALFPPCPPSWRSSFTSFSPPSLSPSPLFHCCRTRGLPAVLPTLTQAIDQVPATRGQGPDQSQVPIMCQVTDAAMAPTSQDTTEPLPTAASTTTGPRNPTPTPTPASGELGSLRPADDSGIDRVAFPWFPIWRKHERQTGDRVAGRIASR